MLPSDVRFTANPAERLAQVWARPSSRKLAALVAVLVATLIHLGVIVPLFFEAHQAPGSETQEIPVEIVAEPPPQQEPPPKPEPRPPEQPAQQRSLNLEAATDAPAQAKKDKIDRPAPEQSDKAAQTPQPAEPAKPAPPTEEAEKAEQGEAKPAEKPPEPVPDKPDAEVIRQAEIAPDARAQQPAEAEGKPAPRTPSFRDEPSPWSKHQSFTAPETLDDVEAVSAAENSPMNGKAKTTYLTVVYGMVMSHMRVPAGTLANSPAIEGMVVFSVDGEGRLTRRRVANSSGSPELDSAAVSAVDQAAPFPPPPGGIAMGMTFTYGAK